MEKGDQVVLQKPLGPCAPGCKGVVVDVDSQGNITVEITHDENGNGFFFLLPPVTADYYE
jgi:hypothetical protein